MHIEQSDRTFWSANHISRRNRPAAPQSGVHERGFRDFVTAEERKLRDRAHTEVRVTLGEIQLMPPECVLKENRIRFLSSERLVKRPRISLADVVRNDGERSGFVGRTRTESVAGKAERHHEHTHRKRKETSRTSAANRRKRKEGHRQQQNSRRSEEQKPEGQKIFRPPFQRNQDGREDDDEGNAKSSQTESRSRLGRLLAHQRFHAPRRSAGVPNEDRLAAGFPQLEVSWFAAMNRGSIADLSSIGDGFRQVFSRNGIHFNRAAITEISVPPKIIRCA
jgi:hypothetical protein